MSIAERAALAPGRTASGTSRGVVAATHGEYGLAATVASPARTGASTIGSPVAATVASPSMAPRRIRSEAIIVRRRSQRSARTPPSGPMTTIGATRAAVVTATQVVECVRS